MTINLLGYPAEHPSYEDYDTTARNIAKSLLYRCHRKTFFVSLRVVPAGAQLDNAVTWDCTLGFYVWEDTAGDWWVEIGLYGLLDDPNYFDSPDEAFAVTSDLGPFGSSMAAAGTGFIYADEALQVLLGTPESHWAGVTFDYNKFKESSNGDQEDGVFRAAGVLHEGDAAVPR